MDQPQNPAKEEQPLYTMAQLQQSIATAVKAALDQVAPPQAGTSQGGLAIHAVAPKLPAFDPEDAELWLAAIEEEFRVKKVTADATKYSHALAAIDAASRRLIGDIMCLPATPDVNKYQLLKTRLVDAFGSSPTQRIERILDLPPLESSERPSLWLARVKSLAGSGVSLAGQWPFVILLRKLPQSSRELAATKGLKTIDEVIEAADDLWCSIQTGSAQISAVRLADRPHMGGFCPYHQEHGFNAHTCKPPCQMSEFVNRSKRDKKTSAAPGKPQKGNGNYKKRHNRSRNNNVVGGPPVEPLACEEAFSDSGEANAGLL